MEIPTFLGSTSVVHTVPTACVVYDCSTIVASKNTPGNSKVQRSLLHIFQISSTFLLSLVSIHLRVQARRVTMGGIQLAEHKYLHSGRQKGNSHSH